MSLIVPPGGFAGFAQQTAATQQLFAKATGRKGGRTTQRRRRAKKKGKCSCAAAPPEVGRGWGAGIASSSPWLAAGEGIGGGEAPDGGSAPNAAPKVGAGYIKLRP